MRRALALLGLAFAACTGPLDNPSSVHDLRLLALQATPPEIRYPVHGNVAQQQCNPDLGGLLAAGPVALGALVADPAGAGRNLSWSWTFCPQTGDERCPTDPAYVIARGHGPPSAISTSWDLVGEALTEFNAHQACQPGATCAPTPILTAFSQNPLGLCRFGVWLQIGLQVDAPDGQTIYGSELLVFTPVPDDYPTDPAVCPQGSDGGMPPHGNPAPVSILLDGQPLPVSSAVQAPAGLPLVLAPSIPSNGAAPYCLPNFAGGWTLLHETWLFSFMTTLGTFDQEQVGAGGFGNLSGGAVDLNVNWTAPADGGTATVYEITRDGRGGTSWTTRTVELPEP